MLEGENIRIFEKLCENYAIRLLLVKKIHKKTAKLCENYATVCDMMRKYAILCDYDILCDIMRYYANHIILPLGAPPPVVGDTPLPDWVPPPCFGYSPLPGWVNPFRIAPGGGVLRSVTCHIFTHFAFTFSFLSFPFQHRGCCQCVTEGERVNQTRCGGCKPSWGIQVPNGWVKPTGGRRIKKILWKRGL